MHLGCVLKCRYRGALEVKTVQSLDETLLAFSFGAHAGLQCRSQPTAWLQNVASALKRNLGERETGLDHLLSEAAFNQRSVQANSPIRSN